MVKINVSLRALIPTDEFANIRVGMDALDIDTEGDVEAQAQEALVAGIKVMRVLNSGLQEEVATMLVDPDMGPTALKTAMEGYDGRFDQMQRIISRVVTKVQELAKVVEKTPEPKPAPKKQSKAKGGQK